MPTDILRAAFWEGSKCFVFPLYTIKVFLLDSLDFYSDIIWILPMKQTEWELYPKPVLSLNAASVDILPSSLYLD